MPSEVRQLLFKSREIIVAITEYFHRRGLNLPIGTASRVTIAEGQPIQAILDIVTDGGETVDIEVDAEELAAALILYCINRKIPLPVEAEKRLQRIHEDSVALVVVKRTKA
jgi:hypothetical protein